MTEKKKDTPKQVAKRIEQLRDDAAEVRAALAPAGDQPHASLYAIVREADRALQNESLGVYLDELKDD